MCKCLSSLRTWTPILKLSTCAKGTIKIRRDRRKIGKESESEDVKITMKK